MVGKKILIAEDEEIMQITLKDALEKEGYQVIIASDGREGLEEFRKSNFDLVIADLKMPKLDGIQLLSEIKKLSRDTVVMMITAYGTIETAVEAMKLGASDYITKPFLIDELIMKLEKVLRLQSPENESVMLSQQLKEQYKLGNIIGKSKSMQEVYKIINTVAEQDTTVIIYGESGTGKELVAHAIHQYSRRKDKPLIEVSCAALPETLLESELFGYEKGAFTNATRRKKGRFELADKSTLFLDDVDDMKPDVQVKLLRVLQEKKFERVGGIDTISVDVRLIASSKKNLEEAVKNKSFREDLYYRLNVVPIHMPPLRERREDIPLLVEYFIKKYSDKSIKKVCRCTCEALVLMMEYDWPGNVRELENTIERAIALIEGDEILPKDLPEKIRTQKVTLPTEAGGQRAIDDILKEAEREHIAKILTITKGRKKEAAKILGISRKTLWEKMKAYDLS